MLLAPLGQGDALGSGGLDCFLVGRAPSVHLLTMLALLFFSPVLVLRSSFLRHFGNTPFFQFTAPDWTVLRELMKPVIPPLA